MHARTTSPTHFVSERCICLVGSEAMTEHQATTAQQSSREWLKVVTSIAIEYNMLCFQYYPDVRWPTHPPTGARFTGPSANNGPDPPHSWIQAE